MAIQISSSQSNPNNGVGDHSHSLTHTAMDAVRSFLSPITTFLAIADFSDGLRALTYSNPACKALMLELGSNNLYAVPVSGTFSAVQSLSSMMDRFDNFVADVDPPIYRKQLMLTPSGFAVGTISQEEFVHEVTTLRAPSFTDYYAMIKAGITLSQIEDILNRLNLP